MTAREEALGPGRIEQVPRKPLPPVLAIEVSYGLAGCWRTFDLVKFFEGIEQVEHAAYWTLDLTEWGYFEEWERPLAYLLECDRPDITFGIGGEACLRDNTFDVEVDRVSVKARNKVDVPYGERDARKWTESDLALLADHVPWVSRTKPPSPEDLARIPGPLDSPLF